MHSPSWRDQQEANPHQVVGCVQGTEKGIPSQSGILEDISEAHQDGKMKIGKGKHGEGVLQEEAAEQGLQINSPGVEEILIRQENGEPSGNCPGHGLSCLISEQNAISCQQWWWQ